MSNKSDSLGDRMKVYEGVTRFNLTRRMPVIIRVDGKSFHTFTRGFRKPFDTLLMETMWDVCKYLCANIQGCKVAYTQSDEINLLLTDYETITTSAWFDNIVQKMASVSASMATLSFNNSFSIRVDELLGVQVRIPEDYELGRRYYDSLQKSKNTAMFDSRVFSLPKEEVCNYFVWRQQDASRNSVQMLGRTHFSHKELNNKNCNDIQEMLFQKYGINWNNLETPFKRGVCVYRQDYNLDGNPDVIRSRYTVDNDIPIFTQDRNYIEKYL